MAFTQLEEAERLGAKDVADKKLQARANQEIEKGEAESDEEAALQHFEAARKFVDAGGGRHSGSGHGVRRSGLQLVESEIHLRGAAVAHCSNRHRSGADRFAVSR